MTKNNNFVFPKCLFIAFDVWEESEKAGEE
jgi:hypothetical protein